MGTLSKKLRRKAEDFATLLDEASADMQKHGKETRKAFKKHDRLDEAMMVGSLVAAADFAEESEFTLEGFLAMAAQAWLHGTDFDAYDPDSCDITLNIEGYESDDEGEDESTEDDGEAGDLDEEEEDSEESEEEEGEEE